jgi:hypothetical protein
VTIDSVKAIRIGLLRRGSAPLRNDVSFASSELPFADPEPLLGRWLTAVSTKSLRAASF